MTIDAISDLDLSYTPPLGSPWDAVQAGAQAWGVGVGLDDLEVGSPGVSLRASRCRPAGRTNWRRCSCRP
jgi:hypothetical protein